MQGKKAVGTSGEPADSGKLSLRRETIKTLRVRSNLRTGDHCWITCLITIGGGSGSSGSSGSTSGHESGGGGGGPSGGSGATQLSG